MRIQLLPSVGDGVEVVEVARLLVILKMECKSGKSVRRQNMVIAKGPPDSYELTIYEAAILQSLIAIPANLLTDVDGGLPLLIMEVKLARIGTLEEEDVCPPVPPLNTSVEKGLVEVAGRAKGDHEVEDGHIVNRFSDRQDTCGGGFYKKCVGRVDAIDGEEVVEHVNGHQISLRRLGLFEDLGKRGNAVFILEIDGGGNKSAVLLAEEEVEHLILDHSYDQR